MAFQQGGAASRARLKYAELLLKKGMQEDARELLKDLLRDDPGCGKGHYLLAVVEAALGSPREAALHFQEALGLDPEDVKALSGLGVALQQQGRPEQAACCYREALRLHPHYQDARVNLAMVLKEAGLLSEAAEVVAEGVALDPCNVRLTYNLANLLHLQGRSLEAVAAYRATLRLAPEHLDARQNLLFALHYSPRTGDRQLFAEHLKAARSPCFRPSDSVTLPSPGGGGGSGHREPGQKLPPAGRRIRLGYLSPDFREHAVASFIEPVLVHHDRSRFEIFCYANVARPDATSERLRGLAEHWRDLSGVGDEKAASLIAGDGIDILVDLAGHTSGNRLPLFARRPAPLQLTWLGYPDSTGLSQLDYRITDRLADPAGRERFHRERLLRLPRIFCCYLPPEQCPPVAPLPADATGRITFGSFNNLAKVTPELIALWGRVLQAVPGSGMLLKSRPLGDPGVRARILHEFAGAGIAAERIELSGGEDSAYHHLARYGRVDIALDSFPYNGTTTTCEALWMGVPVVSLAGSRHASRTGLSILTNCALGELVAGDEAGYLAIAGELAGNLVRLRKLRAELRGRLQDSPLLDGQGVTRELEAALIDMLE